ncbi:hypothetical protein FRB99_004473 [Tulasnella sp. 403]|nr:hypothetical protein FRB99_004473 [Tulasnella sp. 403]
MPGGHLMFANAARAPSVVAFATPAPPHAPFGQHPAYFDSQITGMPGGGTPYYPQYYPPYPFPHPAHVYTGGQHYHPSYFSMLSPPPLHFQPFGPATSSGHALRAPPSSAPPPPEVPLPPLQPPAIPSPPPQMRASPLPVPSSPAVLSSASPPHNEDTPMAEASPASVPRILSPLSDMHGTREGSLPALSEHDRPSEAPPTPQQTTLTTPSGSMVTVSRSPSNQVCEVLIPSRGPKRPPNFSEFIRTLEAKVHEGEEEGFHVIVLAAGNPAKGKSKSFIGTEKGTKFFDAELGWTNKNLLAHFAQFSQGEPFLSDDLETSELTINIPRILRALDSKDKTVVDKAVNMVSGGFSSKVFTAAVKYIRNRVVVKRDQARELARLTMWNIILSIDCQLPEGRSFVIHGAARYVRKHFARFALSCMESSGKTADVPWAKLAPSLYNAGVILRGWPEKTPLPCTLGEGHKSSYTISNLGDISWYKAIYNARRRLTIEIVPADKPLKADDPVIYDSNNTPVVGVANGYGVPLVEFPHGNASAPTIVSPDKVHINLTRNPAATRGKRLHSTASTSRATPLPVKRSINTTCDSDDESDSTTSELPPAKRPRLIRGARRGGKRTSISRPHQVNFEETSGSEFD